MTRRKWSRGMLSVPVIIGQGNASVSLPSLGEEAEERGMGAKLQSVGPGVVFRHSRLQFPHQQNHSQEVPRTSKRPAVASGWMLCHNWLNLEPGIWYHKMKHLWVTMASGPVRVGFRAYRVRAFLWWGLQGSHPVRKPSSLSGPFLAGSCLVSCLRLSYGSCFGQ